MRQPVIGISPSIDMAVNYVFSDETHYLRRTYTEVLASVGAIPLILNVDMPLGAILSLCDGIVISGGEDIEPEMYNEVLLEAPGSLREPRHRLDWEYKLIDACDGVGMPILGVCYGMQLLNIYHGGTLYQDLPTERPDGISHVLTTHEVTFTDEFLGYKVGDVRQIASRHHQAVDRLGDGFAVCAEAPDGVIEAIRRDHLFGVQWHSESDITGVHIYRAFAEYCAPGLKQSVTI